MPSGVTPYDPSNDSDNSDNSDNSDTSTPIDDDYANWQPDAGIDHGGDCINLYDQECGENCIDCNWSWPSNDPDTWASSQAKCRC